MCVLETKLLSSANLTCRVSLFLCLVSVSLVPADCVHPSLPPSSSVCLRSQPSHCLSLSRVCAPCPLCSMSYPVQVHKLLIVVELLLGEIPDRLQFRQPSLKRSLMPYFLLTQGKAGLPEPCSVV